MNELVKIFMSENKVLVSYVRDVYGYRKGVVIALGGNKLGFSLVKKSEDYEYKYVKPHQLPAVQRMVAATHMEEGMKVPTFDASDIVGSDAYQSCIRQDCEIRVPKFDRDVGLMFAIGSALKSEISFDGDGFINIAERVPTDDDLWEVIYAVYDRAQRYFKETPVEPETEAVLEPVDMDQEPGVTE